MRESPVKFSARGGEINVPSSVPERNLAESSTWGLVTTTRQDREEETPELCSLPVPLTGTQAPSPLEWIQVLTNQSLCLLRFHGYHWMCP